MVRIGSVDYEHDEAGNLIKRRGQGLIKSFPDEDGYLKYHLGQNRKTINIFVHHVIWMIFKGRVPVDMTVDHIDNDPTNNKIENLQLLTRAENSIKGNAKMWTVQDPNGKIWKVYNMEQFCRDHGLHAAHMRSVCNGVKSHHQHKGWTKS